MKSFLFLLFTFLFFSTCGQGLETVIQRGHELAVISVAISPDSNYVATGSRDKSAKLWQLSTGREVRSFLGHQFSVNSLSFSSDGKYLITGNGDATAKIWEVATGKEILSLQPDQERVTDVLFDPKGKFFVTVGFGQKVRVWEFPSKKKIAEWDADGYAGSGGRIALSISPNGEWLAVGEDNSTANVYKIGSWDKKYTFNFSEYSSCGGCYTYVDFSHNNQFLLKASQNGEVAKYNLADGKLAVRYTKKIQELKSAVFSNDENWVAASTKDKVIIYRAANGDSVKTITPKIEADINQARFTLDNKRLLLACDNNTVLIYDVSTTRKIGELTGFLNQRDKGGINYDPNSHWDSQIAKYVRYKNNLLITPDGKTLIKGKFGTKVKQWDIASGKSIMDFVGHEKAALCYDLSRDGKKLVTGGGDGKVILWDVAKGDTLKTIRAHRYPVFDVHFNSDETKVASSSWDATLVSWDLASGKPVNQFDFNNNSALNFLWSRNDLYLFASQGKELKMYEADTKEVVREFKGHRDVISSLRLNSGKQQLLSASWDGTVRLWNITTGLMEQKFIGHQGAVHIAIFDPDGKTIYSAGADRQIRVWDIATAKVIRTFDGHKSEITALLFSPDQKMLISHSVDGVIKFWDLNSGKEFFEHIHFGEKEWMVKSPEGYFNGTDNARQYIHFVNGMKTYGVDQFFEEYYRPELLPKIFQQRGGDGSQGLNQKLKSSPPPRVKIAWLPSTDPAKAEVYIRVTDVGTGVANFKFFHNGKRIPSNDFVLPSGKNQTATYRTTVNLVGGTNQFTASAGNKDKVESDPVTVETFFDRPDKNTMCYVLTVGINQYKNPHLLLNYAKSDAESFGQLMEERGTLFKNIELNTLYDEKATQVNILKKLDELAGKIQPEDVFIFYYAGHGSMVDNRFFFIPTESSRLYDPGSLKKEAIEASVLQDKFKNIKALKQLIVMDACQSGGSVELLASRGASEEKAIAQLSRSAGIHVMASAGSEQFAAEFAELGHGIFTYLLIKALQGAADGAPKDGKVTIYELKSYLDDQVPELTRKLKGKPQYPYTFSRGQDFPVVIDPN
ncbi:MAG: WD40 repeat-containing protein [Cytophagales bacterium]|jgi:WD40 repeat protein|nr:caspase family protein [Bacteroidota bacterium]MBS1981783.1 caspase family protein [Bacteroidota bacterium]WHZ07401.1 MAG: WD40 repeat-containing protein [Cytophagales bacterium]